MQFFLTFYSCIPSFFHHFLFFRHSLSVPDIFITNFLTFFSFKLLFIPCFISTLQVRM